MQCWDWGSASYIRIRRERLGSLVLKHFSRLLRITNPRSGVWISAVDVFMSFGCILSATKSGRGLWGDRIQDDSGILTVRCLSLRCGLCSAHKSAVRGRGGKKRAFGFSDRSRELRVWRVRVFLRSEFFSSCFRFRFGCVLQGNPGVFADVSKCVCTVSGDVFSRFHV
jgi:hypothetical protein